MFSILLSHARRWMSAGLIGCAAALEAAPSKGPALPVDLFRAPSEPPGPSSRRAGVVVSEVMYHPAKRSDGRDVRFIEVFNSMPWFEELGGWRITGDVEFTFPAGFVLPARGYVVIAAAPADLGAAAGLKDVLGPFTGTLARSGGSLKLRNRQNAVLFELDYRDDGVWPVAADGAGPSLVLARPSYGERDPRAWSASERSGGSPGGPEPAPTTEAPRTIVINELLAHPAPPAADFIELFNYSETAVDLSGHVLTDDPDIAKFVLPAGSVIPPRGFLSFTGPELGFGLGSAGEAVFLRSADGSRVLDAVRFGPQGTDVAYGRTPDGAPVFRRLASPSPGAANSAPLPPSVVINELMYHPASDDPADEYIEVHNPGKTAVDLSGWRLEDAVSFTFPEGTKIAGGGYLVVAKDAAHLAPNYPSLGTADLLGDFGGTLSGSGERLALSMPGPLVSTNKAGVVVTNRLHIVVDEVTYGTGGRWGTWTDGGGSSLERRDPRADGRLAPNWGDSDETAKSPWVTVEAAGLLDNGNQPPSGLELFLYGAGECLVDSVQVIGPGGTNRLANPDFETGTTNWVFQGNHGATTLETTGGFESAQSLHVRATGPGHTGPNRVRVPLKTTLASGQTATLRAKVRWLKGTPDIHLRLHGNWLEAPGRILAARDLGTPGSRNSIAVPDAPPAITDVAHTPVLPGVGQPVTVTARVSDVDGLRSVVLRWRRDPSADFVDVPMADNGAGLFSAVIPGQATGILAAFQVVATDAAGTPATATFPGDAPLRECLVRWGESNVAGAMGSYRVWITKATSDRWTRREKLSNDPLDSTFVYGNFRAIYNAGAQYSGSPYHAPSYSGPTSGNCDYVVVFQNDEPLLGETGLNLLQPGNGGGDSTGQQEKHAYWIGAQLGLPFCHRRPVLLYVNGVKRGQVYDDAQQPNGDYVRQWFPDDADGELRKIQLWFEFDNAGSAFDAVGADLGRYTTTGGVKKRARYRWNWPLRSFGNNPNDFTNLFRLVDAVATPVGGDTYTRTLQDSTDVDEWYRTHVTEHIVGNNDSYSYGGGQNMYAYKPSKGPWKLLIWDIDFAFAAANPTSDMVGIGGQNAGPVNTHAPFARLYHQAMLDAAEGPLLAERSNPVLDARYNGMRTNGATGIGSASGIKSFVASRRTYILGLIAKKAAALAFTLNGGADLDVGANLLNLTGTAPLNVRVLTLNGRPLDVTWNTISNWTARVPLLPGTNEFVLAGLDARGLAVTNAPATMRVNFTGTLEPPEGRVVFSEVMHHPAVPGAGYIELRNLSPSAAHDLSGWRIDGIGFTFPAGSVLPPGSYGLVVEDALAFSRTYGPVLKPLGIFPGHLDRDGETLRLVRPGTPPATDLLVDTFTFESGPPWPAGALAGNALQLIDAAQDNNRVANWSAGAATPGRVNAGAQVLPALAPVGLNELQTENITGPTDVLGAHEPWVELFNDSAANANLTGCYLSDSFSAPTRWGFPSGTSLLAGRRLLVWLDGEPGQTSTGQPHTSFRAGTEGVLVLSQVAGGRTNILDYIRYTATGPDRSFGDFPDADPGARHVFATPTPRTANSLATPPLSVFINEWMADNQSTIADRADGAFKDWFELHNAGTAAADLSGFFLANSLTNRAQSPIPSGTVIPAGADLLVWADKKPQLNGLVDGDLHADFKLSAGGEAIALFAPDGTLVDAVTFGPQAPDVSEGRIPDGGPVAGPLPAATPRGANAVPPPVLLSVATDAGRATVTWSSFRGSRYQLESSSRLSSLDWRPVGGTLTAEGRTLSASETADATVERFYRVRLLP